MLPKTALAFERVGRELVAGYLTERDHPWLRAVLDEHARFEGARRAELSARLREQIWPEPSKAKFKLVAHLLERWTKDQTRSTVAPQVARRLIFERAARQRCPAGVIRDVSAELGVPPVDLEASMFADLPSERRVQPLPRDLGPGELALRANQELIAGLLSNSRSVTLDMTGSARLVVRHAQRVGLLCVALRNGSGAVASAESVRLLVSGPLALFRHTRVYGRALASVVPRLAWCDSFELRAKVAIGAADAAWLRATSRDPILPAQEPKRFDSKVESRFARDFARIALDYRIIREPRAFALGPRLVFPDFELLHRHDPSRRAFVEIVGYWTPEYLSKKLDTLRRLAGMRWVVCVDESLGCSDADFASGVDVVWFKRRVDAGAVLAALERRGS